MGKRPGANALHHIARNNAAEYARFRCKPGSVPTSTATPCRSNPQQHEFVRRYGVEVISRPKGEFVVSRGPDERVRTSRFWLKKWTVAAAFLSCILLAGIVFYLAQRVDRDTFLNYFALGLLIFVFVSLFYGIIAIHDVPYEIAKHRGHPQQDAIHAAGWVSLFTLHAIWPFLWIWAMLYRPDRGWGFGGASQVDVRPQEARDSAAERIQELERRVAEIEQRTGGATR